MKRLTLWSVSTLLMMLLVGPGLRAQAGATLLGASELAGITAGVCTTCATDPGDTPPPPPRKTGKTWELVSVSSTPATQVGYTLLYEVRNSTSKPMPVSESHSNECRHVMTSGGIGISKGLNVTIGTTYFCARTLTVSFVVSPGKRVKLYKGDMRYYKTYVVREMQSWSDGSSTPTGRTDMGKEENRYSIYHPVENPL